MKTIFRRPAFIATAMVAMLFSHACSAATPDVFRYWFTPTVVPTNFVGNVRFEAEITGGPSSVVFRTLPLIPRRILSARRWLERTRHFIG